MGGPLPPCAGENAEGRAPAFVEEMEKILAEGFTEEELAVATHGYLDRDARTDGLETAPHVALAPDRDAGATLASERPR